MDQVDAQLALSVGRYEEYLRGPSDDDRSDDSRDSPAADRADLGDVPGLTAGMLAVRLEDGLKPEQGYVIATGRVPLDPQDAAVLGSLPVGGQPQTVPLGGEGLAEGRHRAVATSIESGERLVVGVPLETLERTMARLLAVEAVVFVVVIIVAGAAGGVLVGRALQPLRRVAGTATRVVDVPLGSGAVAVPDSSPTQAGGPDRGCGRPPAAASGPGQLGLERPHPQTAGYRGDGRPAAQRSRAGVGGHPRHGQRAGHPTRPAARPVRAVRARTASRSRAAGSTGLGLAIVAAVAPAHGGRVEVESEPVRTRFTLHLPAAGD
ncbi:MAG: ATP-binding protein [Candidatus Nanopelagicales bacterium]